MSESPGFPDSGSAALILASASPARRHMLTAAGLVFAVSPADIDEAEVMAIMTNENDCVEAADVSAELAARKALAVSRKHPGAVVIGADQVLALGRRLFSKAESEADARFTLQTLRGRTHELVSSVALACDQQIVWQKTDSAFLTMRDFSDEFLGHYMARAGDALTTCVGCYALEGLGIQLFKSVEGDHFTVLGMPLLPLLEELRRMHLVTA